MALLSLEMRSVKEESERARAMSVVLEPSEQLLSAIRDRDDAIAKYERPESEEPYQEATILECNINSFNSLHCSYKSEYKLSNNISTCYIFYIYYIFIFIYILFIIIIYTSHSI